MHALAGKKWCRRARSPCSVGVAVMRGQKMTALARRHVEISVLFATGRDGEAFGCTKRGPLYARHIGIAGQRLARHVEKGTEHRHGATQRVSDVDRIRPTPCVSRDSALLLCLVRG